MIERIKAALNRCGITMWRINEQVEESSELFFVRRELDTRRSKDTRKFEVTVFRDVDGKRGFTSAELLPSMDGEQMERELQDAFFAAQYAANPMYELTEPVQAPLREQAGELPRLPLAQCAGRMARAIFAPDIHADAYVNSAEVFAVRKRCRILSSEGTDVSFVTARVKGEFVVQCKSPEDVELHNTYEYDDLNESALSEKVAQALNFVRDRAHAQKTLKSGTYDLILSGPQVAEVLSYYVTRSAATMLYAHYSDWRVGEDVMTGETVTGERLKLTLRSTVPYSDEGIPMSDLPLLEDGKLANIHGSNRFCRYLGVKPTGWYEKVSCANGIVPFEELKGMGPALWAVTFSDFQMDPMDGHFGGEIRLAYLIEDGKATPVTGGSVNGSILQAQKALAFSTEGYQSARYEGPYALRLKNVSIAGV